MSLNAGRRRWDIKMESRVNAKIIPGQISLHTFKIINVERCWMLLQSERKVSIPLGLRNTNLVHFTNWTNTIFVSDSPTNIKDRQKKKGKLHSIYAREREAKAKKKIINTIEMWTSPDTGMSEGPMPTHTEDNHGTCYLSQSSPIYSCTVWFHPKRQVVWSKQKSNGWREEGWKIFSLAHTHKTASPAYFQTFDIFLPFFLLLHNPTYRNVVITVRRGREKDENCVVYKKSRREAERKIGKIWIPSILCRWFSCVFFKVYTVPGMKNHGTWAKVVRGEWDSTHSNRIEKQSRKRENFIFRMHAESNRNQSNINNCRTLVDLASLTPPLSFSRISNPRRAFSPSHTRFTNLHSFHLVDIFLFLLSVCNRRKSK